MTHQDSSPHDAPLPDWHGVDVDRGIFETTDRRGIVWRLWQVDPENPSAGWRLAALDVPDNVQDLQHESFSHLLNTAGAYVLAGSGLPDVDSVLRQAGLVDATAGPDEVALAQDDPDPHITALVAARTQVQQAAALVLREAEDARLELCGTAELPAAVSALAVAEYLDEEEDAARWVARAFTGTPSELLAAGAGEVEVALVGAVMMLRSALHGLDQATAAAGITLEDRDGTR